MIYMDNSATSPVKEEVFNAMIPYLKEEFGNPSTFSTLTGLNVPIPTWSVTLAIFTPFCLILSNNSSVKCNPAVGAAAEPSYFAYTVWYLSFSSWTNNILSSLTIEYNNSFNL